MTSKRGTSGENAIDRVGISCRKNASTGRHTYVVEMRLPKSGWRLHLGSYPTLHEAVIARDYAAYFRHWAGEKGTSAGGFNVDDHLYEFKESPAIFESMKDSKVRCDEYKRLHTLHEPKNQLQSGGASSGFKPKPGPGGNSPYKELCKAARDDIAVAIEEFRRKRPDLWLAECRTTIGEFKVPMQNVDGSVVGEMDLTSPSSNFEVGSSQSVQSSVMADDKRKGPSLEADQIMSGDDEYLKVQIFPWTASSYIQIPFDKSSRVMRGFNVNQETPPVIKEDSKHKGKEVSKSLLQVELERRKKSLDSIEDFLDSDDDFGNTEFKQSEFWSLLQDENLNCTCDQGTCDQGMSPASITDGGAPSSMSVGTSVEDETGLSSDEGLYFSPLAMNFLSFASKKEKETGLSSNKCNNYHQELVQNQRQILVPQVLRKIYDEPNLSGGEMEEAADHDQNRVQSECHFLNEGHDEMPWTGSTRQIEAEEFPFPDCEGEDSIQHLPQATIADEEVKMDMQIQPSITSPSKSDNVPESKYAPSHMPATTPRSTVEVGRVVSKVEVLKKVVSKVASNKARIKAEMVEKRFKSSSSLARGYSAAAAHTQALFAARLEAEKVKLDTAVQLNNKVKIANLTTAKDNGVISNEEYRKQVKALLGL